MGSSILREQMAYEPIVGHRLPWDCISLQCSTALWIRPSGRRLGDVAQRYNVRSLPTFIFLRGAEQIDRITGGVPQKLRDKVQELALSGSDSHESGSNKSPQSSKQYDMDILLSKSQCECLNEDDTHSLAQLLNSSENNNSKAYLLSDTDEQLIIYITFSQFVRIQSVQINGPKENAPKTVKLFVNQTSTPDFDSCEIGEAVQTLELTEEDIKHGGITQLNFVKFQNVSTLTVSGQSIHWSIYIYIYTYIIIVY
ncbi:unnamed protein product [Schistosoma margrebowiei]|uniref:Uncharacterized protein n=1 Tax=Schistosoma margrebowiei TaxID=48269 RepID=A0A183MZQ5_9TREM|nr:unnamed protein product [Schistosoma margrebowiei]